MVFHHGREGFTSVYQTDRIDTPPLFSCRPYGQDIYHNAGIRELSVSARDFNTSFRTVKDDNFTDNHNPYLLHFLATRCVQLPLPCLWFLTAFTARSYLVFPYFFSGRLLLFDRASWSYRFPRNFYLGLSCIRENYWLNLHLDVPQGRSIIRCSLSVFVACNPVPHMVCRCRGF